MTIPRTISKAFVTGLVFIAGYMFFMAVNPLPAEAVTKNPGAYGYKKASKTQKRALKRAARKVKRQRGWFVSKAKRPRFGIVCGNTRKLPQTGYAPLPGAAYKLKNGRWRYHATFSSGGMQTITGLCTGR